MNYSLGRLLNNPGAARKLFAAALVLGCVFATATSASAQSIASPTTPDSITPPVGNSAFLLGRAVGTQGYVCLPTANGTLRGPSMALGRKPPFLRASSGRTSRSSRISSAPIPTPTSTRLSRSPSPTRRGRVPSTAARCGHRLGRSRTPSPLIPAGSDPSCPNAGAIACLLLQSIGSLQGPTGGKVMTQTTFVQRLNTAGGSAPADGCLQAGDVGKQTLVPYTADYYFFRGNK